MKNQTALLVILAILGLSIPAFGQQRSTIRIGDVFPAVSTQFNFTAEELAYFGIEKGFFSVFSKNSFALSDINSEIVVVEFFNTYCTSCQAQAPVMNQVYKAVQKSPELRKKVRFIGIGAGNNDREVTQFKQQHQVPFPLLPDQRFLFYDAIGEPGGTPFMLVLKKRGSDFVVVDTHLGLATQSGFTAGIRNAAEKNIDELTSRVVESDFPAADDRKLNLNLSLRKQQELIAQSMASACGNCDLSSPITVLEQPSGYRLYTAQAELAGKKLQLYSRLFSQKPVCDVCHGIHYIITFDARGYIRDFTPIHITKYGNIDWNEYDIGNMRKQLIGKRLTKELIFDPTLDAISSATMSSALIYKGVGELHKIYKQLD